jgi:hypothetical protein
MGLHFLVQSSSTSAARHADTPTPFAVNPISNVGLEPGYSSVCFTDARCSVSVVPAGPARLVIILQAPNQLPAGLRRQGIDASIALTATPAGGSCKALKRVSTAEATGVDNLAVSWCNSGRCSASRVCRIVVWPLIV